MPIAVHSQPGAFMNDLTFGATLMTVFVALAAAAVSETQFPKPAAASTNVAAAAQRVALAGSNDCGAHAPAAVLATR
jgi:hypothetical protein